MLKLHHITSKLHTKKGWYFLKYYNGLIRYHLSFKSSITWGRTIISHTINDISSLVHSINDIKFIQKINKCALLYFGKYERVTTSMGLCKKHFCILHYLICFQFINRQKCIQVIIALSILMNMKFETYVSNWWMRLI